MIMDTNALVPSKMSPGPQNMKTGHDGLGTAETESGRANINTGNDSLGNAETESGAQNLKTGNDTLGTTENKYERAKHQNGTRRPPYRRKRVRARKT
jgi:hypothetical protein